MKSDVHFAFPTEIFNEFLWNIVFGRLEYVFPTVERMISIPDREAA